MQRRPPFSRSLFLLLGLVQVAVLVALVLAVVTKLLLWLLATAALVTLLAALAGWLFYTDWIRRR